MPKMDFFPPRPDSHPMIYAYSDNNPMYKGMLKIGYTKSHRPPWRKALSNRVSGVRHV